MTTPAAILVAPWRQPLSCYSVLVTPPTEEPITVAEAKLRAGLDWAVTDPREALVPKMIAAARHLVERETGLALLTQTRDIYFCPYDPQMPWPLPSLSTPLQTIEEVVDWDPAPSPMLGRAVRPLQALVPRPLDVWGPTPTMGARMRIVAGWPSVAALEAEAPTLVQAVGLLVAHMLTLGRDLAITGAVAAISETPQGYEDCIAPHRLVWVT
jgi:uncharacterized phiE125 gp8 family phage protein